jgi:hypothetical protein
MPDPDGPAGPKLYAPGQRVLVEAEVVTVLATGARIKVAGMTPGHIHYFCVDFNNMAAKAEPAR